MALYSFTLEKFHIDTTRSLGDDTDTVTFAVQVGASGVTLRSLSTGDVDSGDVSVNLSFGPQFVATGEYVVLSYFIYNGDTSKLSIRLDELSKRVIDEYVQQIIEGGPSKDPKAQIPDDPRLPNNATFEDLSWVNVLELAEIGSAISSFFFPDCDGMVAADVIGRSKTELDSTSAIYAASG